VVLHSKVADYVQNNRRRELADLERTYHIVVEIVGEPGVELSTERFEWFDVPAWEVPGLPDRSTGDEDDDRVPAEPAAPTVGEPVETPPGDASPPRPAPEQRDGAAGGGKRSRRKRRRRGRNRDGSAQEPSPREWGAPPAASIGSVVEVDGNAAPETEALPADGGQPRETGDASAPSSRRRRRRRKRSRSAGPVGELPFERREAPPVSKEVPAEPIVVRQDEAREAARASVAPLHAAEQPAEAAAPTSSGARVPEAGGETGREAPLPSEELPVKKTAKKRPPKKAAAPKEKPAKAAPRNAAVRKHAAGKALPAEPTES
jgi:ribonuclease E